MIYILIIRLCFVHTYGFWFTMNSWTWFIWERGEGNIPCVGRFLEMRDKYPLFINASIYPLAHRFSKTNWNNQFCGNHGSQFVFKSQRTGQRTATMVISQTFKHTLGLLFSLMPNCKLLLLLLLLKENNKNKIKLLGSLLPNQPAYSGMYYW